MFVIAMGSNDTGCLNTGTFPEHIVSVVELCLPRRQYQWILDLSNIMQALVKM